MREFKWKEEYTSCDWNHACECPWCDADYGHCNRLDAEDHDCREESCPIMRSINATRQS